MQCLWGSIMKGLLFHNFDAAPRHVAPFSHAVECDGWIQLTGQMPTDPDYELKPLANNVSGQTRRVMENLIIVLAELNLSLEHVVSVRVFLTEFKRDYEAMNDVYKGYFPVERLPARTCIGVTALARDALVEIDMVARRPE